MKSILLICALLLSPASAWPRLRHDHRYLESTVVAENEIAQELWIDQKLDHFDPNNTATFQQKLFLNDAYWSPNLSNGTNSTGPMLLYISGEGPLGNSSVLSGSGASYFARELGALIVSLEHRFYGSSLPFGANVSTEALSFLHSRQALADLAYLIDYLRSNGTISMSTPVITVGGSYAGALSAWMKEKYPSHLVGAHSSSGPVHAQQDFQHYLDVVADGLGSQCTALVQNASTLMDAFLATPQGRLILSRYFDTCSHIETDKDAGLFVQNILGPLTALVQYNTNYRALNITSACQWMYNFSATTNQTALVTLAEFNKYYNSIPNMPFGVPGCVEANYTKYVQEDMQGPGAGRSWTYQCCNEFGWWQTSEDEHQPFSSTWNTLDFQQGQCVDIFGKNFSTAELVDANNAYYGGRTIHADNLFMANGATDPWHNNSIWSEESGTLVGSNARYQLIGPTSHCQDIGYPRPSDIPELQAIRVVIIEKMKQWIAGTGGDESSDDTIWIITVCVIGGLAVILLLVCVGWRMKQTAANKPRKASEEESMYSHLNA